MRDAPFYMIQLEALMFNVVDIHQLFQSGRDLRVKDTVKRAEFDHVFPSFSSSMRRRYQRYATRL